jgi:Fe-S oxidoreductase
VKKFGSSLEHRLVTSIELAGRTTRKFSAALKMLMDLKAARIAGQVFTGISAQRDFIAFAGRSLFERIRPVEGDGEIRALYFAGCYASYIRPEIGEAAVKVLKSLGMTVYTPPQHCCGLPMLSKGMIKQAKDKVAQNTAKWRDLLESADHVVVTCSSCGLSLMKEWSYLLDAGDVDTLRGKTIHISRLINQNIHKLNLKEYPAKVSYHNPCHLKIQLDPESSMALLSHVPGLELEDLKSHCCGMAGSWGISAKNYDLSVKIGSDMISKLNSSDASVGVTDCPTCRIQMEQLSEKQIRHPIEIIAQCLP